MKKKIFLFLTLLFGSSLFSPLCVHASAKFYEAEYIPDVYIIRKQGAVKQYAQGRVLRNKDTDEIVYCLQPFTLFDGNALYESADKIESLSTETLQQIEELVSFSYPLGDTNLIYYMATQLRIWQILEPNCEFYFTDTLNGNKTTKYDVWFDIINDHIRVQNKLPKYANQTYTTTVDGSISVTIPVSGTYTDLLETDLDYKVKGSTVTFNNLKEGDYDIRVRRRYKTYSNQPMIFYFSHTSQTLMNRMGTKDKFFTFKLHVVDASIHVKKIDKDTQSKQASGEASLKGAVFSIYDSEKKKLATFTFDDSLEQKISVSSGTIDHLPFGNYTIQEQKAGEGYLCNSKIFNVTLDEEHPHIEILLENEVIKNKVTLKKMFGNQQKLQAESNVVFEIYDSHDNLFKTVETNQEGLATFLLPYGTYRIHQKTTQEGYQKVEDFEVVVKEDQKEHHYTLYDQEEPKKEEPKEEEKIEIEVPNTKKNQSIPVFDLLISGVFILYVQKKNRI